MKKSHQWTHRRIRAYVSMLFLLSSMAVTPQPQAALDFSGLWKQDNTRCQPKRNGDVTLRIEQSAAELTIETSILHSNTNSRHAVQRYWTDGNVSISTGADGDTFHTSVVRAGASLIFSIEEHEVGRIILSKETWTLIENGTALQRVRDRAEGGEKQTLIYLREAPQT